MIDIVQRDNPVLRQVAKPVAVEDIGTPRLNQVLEDMKKALSSQDDGVAIAAPQIGASLRIFIIAGRIIDMIQGVEEGVQQNKDLVCINPEFVKLSKQKKDMEEGCLSVRYLYGKTRRSYRARIRATNEHGQVFELGGSGLLAQIFQHETDHLNGILFIDHAKDVHDLPPKKSHE